MSEPVRSPARLLYPCFFLSGFAGLVLELVWARALGGIFGSSTLAVSTVLAVYFGGLALGSLFAGRLADSPRFSSAQRLTRLYGFIELGVGLYALISLPLIESTQPLYAAFAAAFGLGTSALHALRVIVAGLCLALPTLLMGATLPIVVRALVDEGSDVAPGAGRLYATNTFGAVLGTLCGGFVLLPAMGMAGSVRVAAVANLGVFALAFVLARQLSDAEGEGAPAPATPVGDASPHRVALAIASLSGLAALGYEVVWTRMLGVHFFNTTYGFTLVLAAFLTGIGLGSLVAGRYTAPAERKAHEVLAVLFVAQLAIGIWAVLANNVYVLPLSGLDSGEFQLRIFKRGALCFALMLVPAALMGATFPLTTRLYAGHAAVGERVGRLYAFNTVGGILGSLVTGFFLVPAIGLLGSACLLGAINVVAALLAARGPQARIVGAVGLLVCLFAAAMPSALWPSGLLELRPSDKILHYRDGHSATVAVVEREASGPEGGSNRILIVNGKREAAASLGRWMIRRLAHIPLLLHPAPKDALMLGFGAGITTGAASLHPELRVQAVEILPEAVEAARFFAEDNRGVLERENVKVLLGDGRNVLALSPRDFDVIVSDLYFPWEAGVGYLYSEDHYRRAKARLRDGGLYCQWVSLYQMSEPDLRSLTATFMRVFPEAELWLTHREPSFVALVGAKAGPVKIDVDRVRARFETPGPLRDDLHAADLDQPITLLALRHTGAQTLARWSQGAMINRDAHPWLEFTVPHNQGMGLDRRRAFLDAVTQLWSPQASALVGADPAFRQELDAARRAARLMVRSRLHLLIGDHAGRARDLRAALRERPDPEIAGQLDFHIAALRQVGPRYLEAGRLDQARRVYEALIEVDEPRPEYEEALRKAATGTAAP